MAEPTAEPSIDETPITSPIEKRARGESIAKHLQHRPEAQELKDKHILLDTTAAP